MMHANPTQSLESLLAVGAAELESSSPSARLDAELLLAHALDRPRSYLRAHGEDPAGPAAAVYAELITARRSGKPVAHLLGEREFWSLPLKVTADTLIPRPDTETLVARALTHLDIGTPALVLDLGTGSGAIALALASERPDARVLATDRSPSALAVAQDNRQRLGLDNVQFRESHWFAALEAANFDLIVSNPPYVAENDPHLRQGDVRFEPRDALSSGPDGLDDLREIIGAAPRWLRAGGWLLVEHGFDQADAVSGLFVRAGFGNVASHRDDAGHRRLTEGQWRG